MPTPLLSHHTMSIVTSAIPVNVVPYYVYLLKKVC